MQWILSLIHIYDVKALLPTTAQSSASAYAPAAVYAESEDVTDEPPREMTKACLLYTSRCV